MEQIGNVGGSASTALVRLSRSLELVGQLFRISEEGRTGQADEGCMAVYKIVNDSAQRIQACTVAEMMAHQHEPPDIRFSGAAAE